MKRNKSSFVRSVLILESRLTLATDTTWAGGNGSWDTGALWSNGVPNNGGGNTYAAIVNTVGPQTITLPNGVTRTINSFTAVNGTTTIGGQLKGTGPFNSLGKWTCPL